MLRALFFLAFFTYDIMRKHWINEVKTLDSKTHLLSGRKLAGILQ